MKQIFTLITILTYVIVNAQQNKAGTLDSSFGVNGKVLTSFPNSYPECTAAAVTKQGDIIAAGRISPTNNSFAQGLMAVKYSADGVLDTTFGNKGVAIAAGPYEGHAVAVQPDNKIIISGVGYGEDTKYIVAVRLNANGSIDSSFGENGTIININGTIAFAIALQQDGKIVLSGTNGYAFVTLRYLNNGTIDESFGNNGLIITDYNSIAYAQANLIQPDGKIVVAGDDGVKILLARYNTDGSVDNTFGNTGKIIFKPTSEINKVYKLSLQSDGKLIVAGGAGNLLNNYVQLLRFLPEGLIDNSFGNNGIAIKRLQYNSQAYGMKLQSDGKILICGYAFVDATYGHFLVERFNNNGILDSSFGNNGYQITEMNQYDAAIDLILQDNKIVIVGGASNIDSNPPQYQIALARYNNDLTRKQIIITKIKRWLQHHNGFTWNANNNISSYVVQRSYDGISWKAVSGKLQAAGNQSQLNYEDVAPLSGTNYYRLQTTSVDGTINYSNVLAVTNDDIKISPNPATNSLHIEGLSPSQKIKLTVVDFAGNIALSQQLKANGNSSYNLNIASLKTGNYLLKIETSNDVITKSFVKE